MNLSVIIPLYNNAPYIRRCVESLYVQGIADADFEVIIVDDGSTDGGSKLADEIAGEHTNVKVLHQENKGTGVARNAGIEVASGEYIHFVDADDLMLSGAYRYLTDNVFRYNPDVVCFDYVKEEESAEDYSVCAIKYVGSIRDYIRTEGIRVNVWNKLYRRSFIANNKLKFPALGYSEDTYFTWDAMHYEGTMVVTDAKLYFYRTNPKSIEQRRDPNTLKRTISELLKTNQKLKELSLYYDDCPAVANNFTHKYRVLFNRIICTPYSCHEIKELFAKCSVIGIRHLKRETGPKVMNFLYLHPTIYYVFRKIIRMVYFYKYPVSASSSDFINRSL